MAMTGVLLADFSAFKKEATESAVALKQMESGADAAAGKLSKLGEGFNLKSLVEDPLGHAKEMATGFAESLGTVGVSAIAAAGGIGALGAAMFTLAVKSADTIAAFDDLADKTGMSVPALSRMSHAANVVGADMGQLTDVVYKVGRGIGENSEAFQKGLAMMGLTTAQLKAEGPDRYLEVIVERLKGIDDPTKRAAAGNEVLGKSYKDVAASLNDLATGYELTKDITPFTKQQAADAEAFLFQLASLKEHALALGVTIGASLIPPLSLLIDTLGWLKEKYDSLPGALKTVLTPMSTLSTAFGAGAAAVDYFLGSAVKLPETTAAASASVASMAEAMGKLTLHVPTLADGLAAQKEVMADLDAVTRRVIESTNMLNEAGAGWEATLDSVDGSVVEAVQFYLSAGVSQGELAKAYGLTAAQVKAVGLALDEYAAKLNATADFEKAAADRRIEISKAMTKATNDQVLADFTKRQEAEKNQAAYLDFALKDAQAEDAKQLGYAQTATAAKTAAEETRSAYVGSFGESTTAFETFRGTVVRGTHSMVQETAADMSSIEGRLQNLARTQASNPTVFVNPVGAFDGMQRMQTRDVGGPVTAGESYLIGGGNAPEIFTPGASGFVTPTSATPMSGGGMGVSVTNIFNIVDTEANITRRVSDNITRSIMAAQKL